MFVVGGRVAGQAVPNILRGENYEVLFRRGLLRRCESILPGMR